MTPIAIRTLTSSEVAEEVLDEVEPGRGRGKEVEVDARIAVEPGFDLRVLVRRVVVENEVQFQIGVDPPLDTADEAEELLMAVPGETLVNDLAGGHVECSEEGRGAVPLVVVSHRPGASLLQGETRLGPVQGLDLTLQ